MAWPLVSSVITYRNRNATNCSKKQTSPTDTKIQKSALPAILLVGSIVLMAAGVLVGGSGIVLSHTALGAHLMEGGFGAFGLGAVTFPFTLQSWFFSRK